MSDRPTLYVDECEHRPQRHSTACFVPVELDYLRASQYARDVEGIYISPGDIAGIVNAALGGRDE